MKNMEEYNIRLKTRGWIKKAKSKDMTFHDMYSN